MNDSNKDRYAVLGNPIEHSRSPDIHQQFAEQLKQAMTYQRQLVPLDEFAASARSFFDGAGAGLNITVPFKLEAYQFADQLSERARRAGAVNTLINKDGTIIGDNTDGCGLLADLQNNLQWPIERANILVLGAGGAVRGILEPLLLAKPASIVIANRTLEKAEELSRAFQPLADDVACQLSAQQYSELMESFDIIINGTSASLSGDALPIANECFNTACCYDMMYAKAPTPFLQLAAKQGARKIADGLGMLVEQAAESFRLWRDIKPDTRVVIQSIRNSL
ncbi:MAG: shikimate dehydrogenase [Cellvibrionales bacterium]|jgi:shikimate dehydrogenase|nr:shikimate dehydrogenase [Cellvibrionales bacterium]